MHSPRLIPVLLLAGRRLIKTRSFANPVYVGDPLNILRIFNDKEVDELVVLDVEASKRGAEPDFELIEELATQCAMPLCFGGGIKTTQQAQKMFHLGVEKVCVQNAALADARLIRDLSSEFGSQAIVASIDIKKRRLGGYRVFDAATGTALQRDWKDHLQWLVVEGAGEVLLTSVDREGSMSGPDLNLIQQASALLEVPLVAHGGVGSLSDVDAALAAGADAVAAGSFLVFHGPHRAVLISYPKHPFSQVSIND